MQSYRSESALTDYVGPRPRNRALTPLPHRARLEPSAAADARTAQCGKMLCYADKSLTNFGDVSALSRIRPPPVNSCPAGSATPPEHPFKGSPVAGAPGWYVVQRTAPASSGHPWRWARRFALLAVAVALGLVVLVFSIVRAHWGEAPARQAVVVSMPPLATSTGTRAAPGPTLAPNAPIEDPGRPRNTLATVALQTKPDPVLPDEFRTLAAGIA